MPRSIWKGAVSFGLVTIPVKLYGATQEKDISFRQVHAADNGRIRYKRVCEVCGEEVPYAEIAKGYEAADGRMAVLTDEDFADLPAAQGKAVEVVQFVDVDEIDPTYFDRTYFLEPEKSGNKPYILLRQALAESGKAAVVKVALRSRESLALIRPVGEVLRLHTMIWPDELRDDDFAAPTEEVKVNDAEVGMARMFIEQLSGKWDPDQFTDDYREALEKVIEAKLEGVELPVEAEGTPSGAQVVDLVEALRASVEAAKARRAQAQAS
ncbi:MAG TPA: Ku protein [Propionicimonas sp.]|nr:Ku protein [Propionicimonas sp.]HQA77603.1 Ku protein [Propionicimonas sp.]HQD95959.1 Ku protein [Propionicimonas sp.]